MNKSPYRNYTLKINQEPLIEPLDLVEVKNYLKIDFNDDNDLIESLILTVRQAAEKYLGLSLITQRWSLLFDGYIPQIVDIKLNVQNVTSVYLYDKKNNQTIIDADKYHLNAAKNKIVFVSSHISHIAQIVIETGFGDNKTDVPEPIKQAMLLHIAAIYDNRAGGDVIPDHAKLLYNQYRLINL